MSRVRASDMRSGVRWWRPAGGVAGALAVTLLLQSSIGLADDTPVDALEARAANMDAVVAGLQLADPLEAQVVDAQEKQILLDSDAVPLQAQAPVADEATVSLSSSAPPSVDMGAPSSTTSLAGGAGNAAASGDAVVGGLPVTLAEPEVGVAPQAVKVRVADQDEAADQGVTGVVVELTDASTVVAADSAVSVRLSYADFAGLSGGDWGDRLTLFQRTGCEDPASEDCEWVPLDGVVNDPVTKTLTATVPLAGDVLDPTADPAGMSGQGMARSVAGSGGVTVAAAAGASGSTGNWGATSLAPSAAWSTSGSTGAFTWSYPIDVPDVPGGLVPSVGLSYSSAASDGRTASTNNQASWVGEGFELTSSYIERKFEGCEGTGLSRADLCWGRENATLVLEGSAIELVYDEEGLWRPKNDDGTRVERLKGASSVSGEADENREYWIVTTSEGLRYEFGSPSSTDASNSTWTVPVFGTHPAAQCAGDRNRTKPCQQAWRWNLRQVTDRSGNAMTYSYARDLASYVSLTSKTVLSYHPGGYLKRIDYGLRATNLGGAAPASVVFDTVPRCRSGAPSCDVTKMRKHADEWPDSPADLYCAPGSSKKDCGKQNTPVFFTSVRLAAVRTEGLEDSTRTSINRWTLTHAFTAPEGKTSNRQSAGEILELTSIQREGLTETVAGVSPATVPAVRLGWQLLANRVDSTGDGPSAMRRPRLVEIRSESGSSTSVQYTTECTSAQVEHLTPETNTKLCFPVNWAPEGQTKKSPDWFHKYVVDSITESGTSVVEDAEAVVTGSEAVVTSYAYGGVMWAKPTGLLIKDKELTYSDFRGAQDVTVTVGDETHRTITRYLQGRKDDGGPVTVTVGPSEHQVTLTDDERLVGVPYSTETYNKTGGKTQLVSQVITKPEGLRKTATPDSAKDAAPTVVGKVTTYGLTYTKNGDFERWTRSTSTFDDQSRLTTVDDDGELGVSGDETCTRASYAEPLTVGGQDLKLYALVSRTQVVSKSCAEEMIAVPVDVVSDTLVDYDDRGRVATTWTVDPEMSTSGGRLDLADHTGYVKAARTAYDPYGRPTEVKDAQGNVTTTAYTSSTGGLLAGVTVTTPAPSVGGRGFTSSTAFNPLTGTVASQTDPNKKTTRATYDNLGRLLSVRYPQHAKTSKPSVEYTYSVKATGLNAVTTFTLGADGSTQHRSSVIYDGLARTIQTQQESKAVASKSQTAASRGRAVTHTFYDAAGQVKEVWGPWWAEGRPVGALLTTPDSVDSLVSYRYDAAGRQTDEILWESTSSDTANEQYRTVTVYDGSRTTVVPPEGGTAVTRTVDAQGRTSQLSEFTRRPTVTISSTGASTVPGLDATITSGANQVSVTYEYDERGRLETVTDSGAAARRNPNTWTYTYDMGGRQTSAVDPDSGKTISTYDDLGRVTSMTDATGSTLTYAYDKLGRKVSVSDAGGVRASFVYDAAVDAEGNKVLGQLASATRTVGSATYVSQVVTYDDAYRPLATKVTLPAAGDLASLSNREFTTRYTYTADGQRESVSYPKITSKGAGESGKQILGGETVTTYYDAASVPQWMAGGFGWGTYVAESTHDYLGRARAVDLGNTYGAVVSYDYDEVNGRLAGISLDREQVSGTDLAVTYAYDAAGNVTGAMDAPNASAEKTRPDNQCFGYDGLRRLTQAWTAKDAATCTPGTPPTTNLVGGAAPYWTTYAYDDLGNRTQQVNHATTSEQSDTTTNYTYGTGAGPHVLTSSATGNTTSTYTYDAAGRQTSRTLAGAATQTQIWDPESELSAVKTGSTVNGAYVYDANGDRLTRADATGTTVYLPGGLELLVTNAGVVSAARYYAYEGNTVAVRTGNGLGAVTSLVNDAHGTTLAAIPNTAPPTDRVIKQYTDAFGATRGTAAAIPGDRQFLDKTRDTTGLTMIGARYYDETTGRFISVDPVMDLLDPQQWNGYAYANNNPTTYADPTGLMYDGSTAGYRYTHQGPGGGYIEKVGVEAAGGTTTLTVQRMWAVGRPKTSAVMAARVGLARDGGWYGSTLPDASYPAATIGHLLLDLIGAVPGAEPADALNSAWYAAEGDAVNAGFSAAAMIPFVGWFATAGKWIRNGARAVEAANTAAKAHVDPGKFDYLFGKVTSGSHNLNRSLQNERQLASVGVFDDSAGRALLSEHLDGVAADGSNILRQYTDEFGTFQIRESLFAGPNGILKFESAWQVTDDGLRLTTVIPFGRG